MNKADFYRVAKLPPYVFATINELKAKARAEGRDIVDLGMGNPDGPTPEPVVAKLCEAAHDRRNHRYSQSRGIRGLRQALADRYARNYGVSLDPDTEVITTIGAKDAVAHLLFATIGPGDAVITPTPAYPIHVYGVVMAEGEIVRVPLKGPDNFLDDVELQARLRGSALRAVLVSFPHNPTTATVDPDFFVRLVALAHQHGFVIIHDFAYADLGFDGYTAPSLLQAEGSREVGVEIFSLSKSYNMAGWRVGFCVGNRRLISALARIKSYLDYGNFQPIQIAASVALRECESYVAEIRETYRRRRDVLVEGLQQAAWSVEPPRASMFVWAPIPERWQPLGSLEFARRLIVEAGVAVSPGVGFGDDGEGHVRFSLIENPSRLRQALRGIKNMGRGVAPAVAPAPAAARKVSGAPAAATTRSASGITDVPGAPEESGVFKESAVLQDSSAPKNPAPGSSGRKKSAVEFLG